MGVAFCTFQKLNVGDWEIEADLGDHRARVRRAAVTRPPGTCWLVERATCRPRRLAVLFTLSASVSSVTSRTRTTSASSVIRDGRTIPTRWIAPAITSRTSSPLSDRTGGSAGGRWGTDSTVSTSPGKYLFKSPEFVSRPLESPGKSTSTLFLYWLACCIAKLNHEYV